MNFETTQARVTSYLREGAELRLRVAQENAAAIIKGAMAMSKCLQSGGKLLFFGNGGSAADAQHLAAELVGRFVVERPGLAAIALTTNASVLTAVGNDYGFDRIFARQIQALGRQGDVAVAISTSGNSPNVLAAMKQARVQGIKTVALSGNDGGELAREADITVRIVSTKTALIQECHIAIGHLLCDLIEQEFLQGSAKLPPADLDQPSLPPETVA
jgi:D-sedoheptulose 7-phosphate isomerase